MQKVDNNVVLGIPTTGNIHALLVSLTAVAQGSTLPCQVIIRSEGHFPSFAHYYLEQLADVYRQRGVEFIFAVTPSKGLRGAVDWLLSAVKSKHFWMIADDVMPCPTALENLMCSAYILTSNPETRNWGYITGNKQDVNNRRGWPDYSQTENVAVDYCPTYGNYARSSPQIVRNRLLDNSHALFNLDFINGMEHPPRETLFDFGYQSGGDDTLFGLYLQHVGLAGWFCPHSQAFHLEKESQNFNEPTARVEAIYRQSQILGIKLTKADLLSMFPYTRKYGSIPE